MTHVDHTRVLHRVRLDGHVKDQARAYNISPSAYADVAARLVEGTTLDERGELVARSGEPVADYIKSRLDFLRQSADDAHLFAAASVPPTAADKPKLTRKLTARDKLSQANGVDPWEGF